jgi:hypothetical protein
LFKIDFRPYLDYISQFQNVIINKAFLQIIPDSTSGTTTLPTNIYYYFPDDRNRRQWISGYYDGLRVEGSADLAFSTYQTPSIGYQLSVSVYSEALKQGVYPPYVLVRPSEFIFNQTVNQMVVDPEKTVLKLFYTTTSD